MSAVDGTVKSILFKNGTVLLHRDDDHVEAVKTDILTKGQRIVRIARNLPVAEAEAVVDCTDKIISPGFVDTHHHVWQTQLRGRHANHTLLEYFPTGDFPSQLYTPTDTFWGQLGGCLDMLDGGTTTVVDFAHLNYSPAHNHTAISATISSGIRSVFCYCPNVRLTSWDPLTVEPDALGGDVMPTLEELGKTAPFGDGRVTLGFAFDGFPFLPKESLQMLMAKLNELKVPLITLHYLNGPIFAHVDVPKAIDDTGALDKRFLIAHSSNMTKQHAELYHKRDVHISTTPSTEFQMAMGCPVPSYNEDYAMKDRTSLGADCHSIATSYIPGEARLALQASRAVYGQKMLDQGKQSKSVRYTVEEAFNQATIRGAYAAKMGDQIGSIAEGKFADLVIFNATSPAMVCAGIHDPVAAIIIHSSPADIDMVVVDGVIRKRGGKLSPVQVDDRGRQVTGKNSLSWDMIAKELVGSREVLQNKMDPIDMKAAEKGAMQLFHVNEADIVDSI